MCLACCRRKHVKWRHRRGGGDTSPAKMAEHNAYERRIEMLLIDIKNA